MVIIEVQEVNNMNVQVPTGVFKFIVLIFSVSSNPYSMHLYLFDPFKTSANEDFNFKALVGECRGTGNWRA